MSAPQNAPSGSARGLFVRSMSKVIVASVRQLSKAYLPSCAPGARTLLSSISCFVSRNLRHEMGDLSHFLYCGLVATTALQRTHLLCHSCLAQANQAPTQQCRPSKIAMRLTSSWLPWLARNIRCKQTSPIMKMWQSWKTTFFAFCHSL